MKVFIVFKDVTEYKGDYDEALIGVYSSYEKAIDILFGMGAGSLLIKDLEEQVFYGCL